MAADKTQAETVILKLDQQISGPADVATGALGRLDAKIAREVAGLGRLEQSLKLASAQMKAIAMGGANGAVDINAYRKQAAAVQGLTDRIANQRDKIAAMREKLVTGKAATQQLGEASKFLGDKLGVTSGQTATMGKQIAELGAYGAIAAVAVLAVVGSIAALYSAISKGIGAAGEMRDELIKLRAASVYSAMGFNWLYNGTRASTAAAEQMQAAITRVSTSSALSRGKLADYAVQIRQARFQGKDFETVLKAMSTAATGGTEAMAQGFLASAREARFFGVGIDKLAERVEKKLGDNARARVLSLDVQLQKLGEGITYIFSGADIDPFLRGLQAVLGMFDANSKSANDMRGVVTKLVEEAIGMFLRFEIVLLTSYIWLRKHDLVLKVIGYTILGVVASFALLGIAIAVVVVAAAAFAAVSVAFFLAPIALIVLALVWLALNWRKAGAAIGGFFADVGAAILGGTVDLVTDVIGLGKAIIGGIVAGLKAAGSAVLAALKDIIGRAVKGVKVFLGIASPSRFMAKEIGEPMGQGVAEGQDRAAPEVAEAARASTAGAVQAAEPGAAATQASGGAPASGPVFNFNNCDFGAATEDSIRAMMHRAFEAETMGAALPRVA